jgi:molecular chaperone GrpE
MPSSPESEGGGSAPHPPDAPAPDAPPQAAEPHAERAAPEVSLAAELARMEDRYKRALADLENYRKRVAQETERRVEEARDALLRDWLEAVDSVERALRMEAPSPLFEGLRSVLEQMEAILARYGVERIPAAGERFDPARHEAIAVRPSNEVADHTVLEVVRSGFTRGDRVLRPAQVVVARQEQQAS